MVRRWKVQRTRLNYVWHYTARKLKLARMDSENLEDYGRKVGKYIDLHRHIEDKIKNDNIKITRAEYLRLLDDIEKVEYTSVKDFLKGSKWE